MADFVLGKVKGDKGDRSTITIGEVITAEAGQPAVVTNTGTSEDAIFNFQIPKGDTGVPAGFGSIDGTIELIDSDFEPQITVESTGSDEEKNIHFNFQMPKSEESVIITDEMPEEFKNGVYLIQGLTEVTE